MPKLYIPYERTQRTLNAMNITCGFCRSRDMNKDTLTCKDCGTTAPNTTFKKKVGKKKDAV